MSKAHPKHPPCPGCDRALYKSPIKGAAVKKTDPWAWCRNPKCGLFGQDQTEDVVSKRVTHIEKPEEDRADLMKRFQAALIVTDRPVKSAKMLLKAAPSVSLAKLRIATEKAERQAKKAARKAEGEPESIRKARSRIRVILVKVGAVELDSNVIGITLAIVSQETGNHEAANALIDKFDLEDRFGILKVES